MLEWKPRLVLILLVAAIVAQVAGIVLLNHGWIDPLNHGW